MISLRKIVAALLALGLAGLGHAQNSSELSVGVLDSKTLAVQQKVEKLFEAGEFERAFFIYRNELVPIGDKYAQYMIGFMYETGIVVERDPVQAAAWYSLAAERGTPEFVAVRRKLAHSFSADEEIAAQVRFRELRGEYGDLIVLLNLIRSDVRLLRSRTGSRIGGDATPLSVIEVGSGQLQARGDFYHRAQIRLQKRLTTLVQLGGWPDIETDINSINLQELETRVGEALESRD